MKFLISISLLLSFASSSWAAKVTVGYFTKESASVFETRIKPFFKQYASCSDCEILNLTPYTESGAYDPEGLIKKINEVPDSVQFLFFDWNERSGEKNKTIADELSKKVGEGRLMVASAGVPMNNEGTCPLDRTLMGQVTNSIIIGELTERDRLLPMCFYGPEMLSAIRPPRDYMGQGLAPLYFVSRLANHWGKRKPQDWMSYLKARKNKSKRIWPELEEFFPR